MIENYSREIFKLLGASKSCQLVRFYSIDCMIEVCKDLAVVRNIAPRIT